MNKKRGIGIILVFCICCGIVIVGRMLSTEHKMSILGSNGEEIAAVTYSDGEIQFSGNEAYQPYVELVLQEVQKVCQDETVKDLIHKDVVVQTVFDKEIYDSLQDAYELENFNLLNNTASVVSDIEGRILACYSNGRDGKNYVMEPTYAASTIKPLSVYGPAIEAGVINWSSMYMDSAYMQVEEKGIMKDWPVNTRPFRNQKIPIVQALKESNNAIAVKILKDYGIQKSCDLLQSQLGLDVSYEQEVLKSEEEDNVLSNLALGYLKGGVTVRQMAENYQVFASGGLKHSTYTIEKISIKDKSYYTRQEEEGNRIFTESTAYIMNRLLKEVVSEGGTAAKAQIDGVDICGKTGTSLDYQDNWFVGITPELICATWYEESNPEIHTENEAVLIVKDVIESMKDDIVTAYPVAESVVRKTYCLSTGKLANTQCQNTGEGYYDTNYLPALCDCQ